MKVPRDRRCDRCFHLIKSCCISIRLKYFTTWGCTAQFSNRLLSYLHNIETAALGSALLPWWLRQVLYMPSQLLSLFITLILRIMYLNSRGTAINWLRETKHILLRAYSMVRLQWIMNNKMPRSLEVRSGILPSAIISVSLAYFDIIRFYNND